MQYPSYLHHITRRVGLRTLKQKRHRVPNGMDHSELFVVPKLPPAEPGAQLDWSAEVRNPLQSSSMDLESPFCSENHQAERGYFQLFHQVLASVSPPLHLQAVKEITSYRQDPAGDAY